MEGIMPRIPMPKPRESRIIYVSDEELERMADERFANEAAGIIARQEGGRRQVSREPQVDTRPYQPVLDAIHDRQQAALLREYQANKPFLDAARVRLGMPKENS